MAVLSKITIIGAGVLSPDQLTLEAVRAMQGSSIIYYLLDTNPKLEAYLAKLGPELVDLGNLYEEGAFDQDIYEQIAEIVLLATKRYAHVCFLVPGHPLIYVTSSSLILDRAQRMGITTTVLPGISSLDTMIIQLRLEIGRHGLQVFEANRFVYLSFKPDPRIPLFLLQPGAIGTGFITEKRENRPRRFEALRDALLRYYPPQHQCVLLVSKHNPRFRSTRRTIAIRSIPRYAELIDYSTSLFIPPSADFEIVDYDFYSRLTDPAYADRLVKSKRPRRM
ncbi:MAG: hypothetical protein JO251_15755 [Verrucomicrobia bacterium]|nr:hypothetical protein [Verrucomicrobiota bacterium]